MCACAPRIIEQWSTCACWLVAVAGERRCEAADVVAAAAVCFCSEERWRRARCPLRCTVCRVEDNARIGARVYKMRYADRFEIIIGSSRRVRADWRDEDASILYREQYTRIISCSKEGATRNGRGTHPSALLGAVKADNRCRCFSKLVSLRRENRCSERVSRRPRVQTRVIINCA